MATYAFMDFETFEEPSLNKLVTKDLGTFEINKTRVVLADPLRCYIPTATFPVWGSKYQIVGTVVNINPGELHVMWDDGYQRRYPTHCMEIYDEKKHGKYKEPKLDPNKGFIIAKRKGNIK